MLPPLWRCLPPPLQGRVRAFMGDLPRFDVWLRRCLMSEMPTWVGHLLAYLFDAAFWFFVISVFVAPVLLVRWKAREKADAAETDRVLKGLLHDQSHRWEQDAL